MTSRFIANTGLSLARTPSLRQQSDRRRLGLLCAVVGLAIASGVIGSLAHPHAKPPQAAEATDPFSYFPAQ
jgi:hypothetical protein